MTKYDWYQVLGVSIICCVIRQYMSWLPTFFVSLGIWIIIYTLEVRIQGKKGKRK